MDTILPALAGEHVHNSLRAHNLAHRRYERRIANFLAHARNLGYNLGQAVVHALQVELAYEVRHHAARNLVLVDAHVGEGGDAALVVAALAHAIPVIGDLKE